MITIVSTILVLGILVFVHELGHFLVAKSVGIRVEKFSLGFPPKLISKKIGETEYILSWIPLGGYVKMAGEDPEEEKEERKPWEFMAKSVWQRAKVIFAGPAMNFILAIVLFWGILFFGGKQRDYPEKSVIGAVEKGGPAEQGGLMPEDEIISINDKPVSNFSQMAEIIYSQVEKPILVKWKREGKEFSATIITKKEKTVNVKGETEFVGKIGIGPLYEKVKVGFFQAFWEGFLAAIFLLVGTVKFLVLLISGQVSVKLLGGPVFIAQTAGETAKMGALSLFSFIGILSVNLSLLNILPIPILDGGHLLFLIIEKLKGKPLSFKQRSIMQQVGLAFLVALILLVTYNDILRWVK